MKFNIYWHDPNQVLSSARRNSMKEKQVYVNEMGRVPVKSLSKRTCHGSVLFISSPCHAPPAHRE